MRYSNTTRCPSLTAYRRALARAAYPLPHRTCGTRTRLPATRGDTAARTDAVT